ncbi:hypothetical protein IHQ71_30845 (plasmid) [Rhizobium sp. TH2]|uniref:hypothetical protein n=1 Tax=Rhizobium sp. TH2 TaxID=2775403 RepID=UPI0021578356|nr:hypothetical protein [Rhizobium sp. TH2]UVC12402.1 hypothetical protein IHQ71_30845 [Rhizobium sp. TH2]
MADNEDVPPDATPGSRRKETNDAYAKIAEQERLSNESKNMRRRRMKELGWPPPTNRG